MSSNGGLLAYRDLDHALGLFNSVSTVFIDKRTGHNIQHAMPTLLRQSIYSRLAGYEDVNDAERLSVDPVMRAITGKNDKGKQAASTNTIGRFETDILTQHENLRNLSDINGNWVQKAMKETQHKRIILGNFLRRLVLPKKIKTLVASQPAREIYQNRSEDCQTQ